MAERTIPLRLSDFADLLEAQQAPHNLVLHMRAAADEIKRLRERTEYWPDNAERDAVIRHQKEEIERLRAALRECLGWHDYSEDMHKPIEVRAAYMRARAALEGRT